MWEGGIDKTDLITICHHPNMMHTSKHIILDMIKVSVKNDRGCYKREFSRDARKLSSSKVLVLGLRVGDFGRDFRRLQFRSKGIVLIGR